MNTENNTDHPDIQPEYIRVLSHQLKSPISSIQSLLNTISEGFTGENNPKTLYFIEKALNRASEAKDMISDLLDYELYAQHDIATSEELDIVLLIHGLINTYTSRASEKNISLHSDVPVHQNIFVQGDPRGLEHAFRNLIENAVKYTPEQGRVTVTLRVDEEARTCCLDVSDSGYGIPENEIETIFEPFYRSVKHKSNIAGTGLGLPIVKRVVENHHGTLTVTSTENIGTTFSVVLPYTQVVTTQQAEGRKRKVVIVGGVTAGPKAAARLRRLDESLDITIVEKSEFLSYTGCGLPLFITDKVRSPQALMSTADNTIRDVHFFESIENITILNNTVALKIDRQRQRLLAQNLKSKIEQEIPYDTLLLATGSELLMPKIPGIWQKGIYSLHTLDEAKAIKKEFLQRSAQDVYIIGGGLIGTSTAEALIETGARVSILEKKAHILHNLVDEDIALKIQHELSKKGIKILTNIQIQEVQKIKQHIALITETDTHYANLVILATGLKPNTILAEKAGLALTESGAIRVAESMQTSDEHIYAIGDCAESINQITEKHEYWPFGSVSTKMGRIAADNVSGRESAFPGAIGTAMFRVIDINAARTGLTLRTALKNGYNAKAMVVTGLDRAHFSEASHYVTLKIIADADNRVILGAQGYGKGEVIPKIQLLACAITQGLTLDDVFNLDLGYAPAFNNPIDIVQTACLVLANKIDGLLTTVTLAEFEQQRSELEGIVDVSPLSEHTYNSIPGSLNVPLENIRLEGIPFKKDGNVVLYSRTSSGAYKAYRYLISKGYTNLRVLEGGYVYWEK